MGSEMFPKDGRNGIHTKRGRKVSAAFVSSGVIIISSCIFEMYVLDKI